MNGRVTLEQILRFVTGMTWEPMFGYGISPSIQFTEVDGIQKLLPTSSTCANILYMPYILTQIPNENYLFEKWDEAYISDFFGVI